MKFEIKCGLESSVRRCGEGQQHQITLSKQQISTKHIILHTLITISIADRFFFLSPRYLFGLSVCIATHSSVQCFCLLIEIKTKTSFMILTNSARKVKTSPQIHPSFSVVQSHTTFRSFEYIATLV